MVKNINPVAISLYIHFPWCIRKCPYCDFNSHEAKGLLPEQRYINVLLQDLEQQLSLFNLTGFKLNSIFMGGGTPSLMSPANLDDLLNGIQKHLAFDQDCEITLEANPGTFETAKFQEFRAIGINRLSIGIQSFQDNFLQKLGRVHNAKEAYHATEIAFKAGFENFNLDLMFGLPDQNAAQAIFDVTAAISLNPTHISYYQLTLEPNTFFHKFPPRLPDDESIFAAQKRCQSLLAEKGFQQYEISAYAKQGFQCIHNLNYWQFGDYLGIGAGAHGKVSLFKPNQIVRTTKPRHPEQYLSQLLEPSREIIPKLQLPLEFMMNHLRLKAGFTLQDYKRLTGLEIETLEPALSNCIQEKLLINDHRIYCSEKGWDFLDIILEKFVA